VSNTRTAKKTDVTLADIQLDAGEQDIRLPEDERAEISEDNRVKAPIKGKSFAVSDEIAVFPLMEWAAADQMSTLAATFRLLKSLVAEDEWPAFSAHVTHENASAEDFGKFINAAMEAISGRPTEAPGHS
jgi:hypothetical protein